MKMPLKMEPIEGSETSVFRTQTPGITQKKTYYIVNNYYRGKLKLR